ncbi:DNA-directed RNA polymerase [Rhodotorula toruloides ATCC 204091]|uniref:DNA-directed RNA polymerase n=1 Tax=Rhodotorula toruloides TaxID=5286 RepID=A0A0K3CDE4_RHOTO|nr:DNA-directed RNA polymerase [Rhodotorula toruloides ATCC 204091]KAK4334344.1 DNA-directed RNA polymerase [Rhodotorula toruloides]PRQ75102.1 DNA-directed RNA polymerase [Rhodotorula toruloides]
MTSTSYQDLDVQVLTPPATPAVLDVPGPTFEGTPQSACDELSGGIEAEGDIVVDWETLLGGCTGETGAAELDAAELERLLNAAGSWNELASSEQAGAILPDPPTPFFAFDSPSILSDFSATSATLSADSPFASSSLPTPATTIEFPPTPALTPSTDFSPTPSTSTSTDHPVRRVRVYWTAQEDDLLMSAKEAPVNRKLSWVAIARKAGLGRTGKECRARYLILKDKRDLRRAEHEASPPDAAAFRPAPRQRYLYSAADDAHLLSLILSSTRVDWSAVGKSLNPPRTGDNCYQRASKLRRMRAAEDKAREAKERREVTEAVEAEQAGKAGLLGTVEEAEKLGAAENTLEELGLAWLANLAAET